MIDMNEINGLSMTNVLFNTTNIDDIINKLEFLNLVFSREGAFIAIKTRFGYVFDKTTLPYKNKGLSALFDDDSTIYYFESFIPKPDITVLEEVLDCFKYVCDKTKEELLIIIYFDTRTEKFITEIVRTQIVSGGSVEYAYNKKYEMSDRYIKYLEIHSHHSMMANFSGTDNTDESNRTLYFCGVLGKINPIDTNIFTMDHKFRIWTGLRFIEIPLYEVFETHTHNTGLSDHNRRILDEVLNTSKIIKQMRAEKNKTQVYNPPSFGTPIPQGGKIDILPNRNLNQIETIRSTLEELGSDPDDDDVLNQLDEDELRLLPPIWRTSGLALLNGDQP